MDAIEARLSNGSISEDYVIGALSWIENPRRVLRAILGVGENESEEPETTERILEDGSIRQSTRYGTPAHFRSLANFGPKPENWDQMFPNAEAALERAKGRLRHG